jgi:hypothetical protein
VIDRNYFARQAATLLKLAKSTTDPKVAAALIKMAADLKNEVDESSWPDLTPVAPGVERPASS